MILRTLICLAGAYLLGSIPTAYLAGRVLRGIDIRQHGSRNVGATNAFRVLGPWVGITVLLIDILKGYLAVWLAGTMQLPGWVVVVVGMTAILGHNWTVFLAFRGGKGVATSSGVFLALLPRSFMAAAIVFVIAFALTRTISVGSMLGAGVLAIAATVQYIGRWGDQPQGSTLLAAYLASALILIRHRANIDRLRKGTENKISFRKG